MSWDNLRDLQLENERVYLRRLSFHDYEALSKIVFDESIWRYFVSNISTSQDLAAFIETAIKDSLNGSRIVFVIIDKMSKTL